MNKQRPDVRARTRQQERTRTGLAASPASQPAQQGSPGSSTGKRASLLVFEDFRQSMQLRGDMFANHYHSLVARRTGRDEQAAADILDDALLLAQKNMNLDRTELHLVDASGLAMVDYLLCGSGADLDLPHRPYWLQLLEPRVFRGASVLALWFHNPYERATFEQNPRLRSFSGAQREDGWQRTFASRQPRWLLELVYAPADLSTAHETVVGQYDCGTGRWDRCASAECPTGQCIQEDFGVVIPCLSCAGELDNWSRWLKTVLLSLSGHFRRKGSQQAPPQFHSERIGQSADRSHGKPAQQQRTLSARLVTFDASYFKPHPPTTPRGSLHDTHRVLSRSSALSQGLLDRQVDGAVLIEDTGPVRSFTRTYADPRYKV